MCKFWNHIFFSDVDRDAIACLDLHQRPHEHIAILEHIDDVKYVLSELLAIFLQKRRYSYIIQLFLVWKTCKGDFSRRFCELVDELIGMIDLDVFVCFGFGRCLEVVLRRNLHEIVHIHAYSRRRW